MPGHGLHRALHENGIVFAELFHLRRILRQFPKELVKDAAHRSFGRQFQQILQLRIRMDGAVLRGKIGQDLPAAPFQLPDAPCQRFLLLKQLRPRPTGGMAPKSVPAAR